MVRTCSGKIIIFLSDYYTTHRWRQCALANTSSLTLYDILYMLHGQIPCLKMFQNPCQNHCQISCENPCQQISSNLYIITLICVISVYSVYGILLFRCEMFGIPSVKFCFWNFLYSNCKIFLNSKCYKTRLIFFNEQLYFL